MLLKTLEEVMAYRRMYVKNVMQWEKLKALWNQAAAIYSNKVPLLLTLIYLSKLLTLDYIYGD